jgi:hypothetical protein
MSLTNRAPNRDAVNRAWRRTTQHQAARSGEDNGDRMGTLEKIGLVSEIARAYLGVRIALRRRGIAGAVEWARRPADGGDATRRVMHNPSADLAAARRLASVTARALRDVPGDTRCLVRSLVLIRLLANRGVPGRLGLALRRSDPAAHAWVEVEGCRVGDPAPPGFVQVSTL